MFKQVGKLIGSSAIDKRNKEKQFFAAVTAGALDIIEEFIKDNINPNILDPESLMTALHVVAEKGDTVVGKYLLQLENIDINNHVNARNGESPLITAIIFHQMGFAALLLKHGANTNIQNRFGRTALHYAVTKRNLIITKKLLFCKAQPNIADAFDNTPLSFSVIEYPSKKICELLLKWKADPNFRSIKSLPLLSELALNCTSTDQIAFVKLLLDHKAHLNEVNRISWQSVLHIVSITGFVPLAKYLLKLENINMNLKDRFGRTAYDIAVEHDHVGLVTLYREIMLRKSSLTPEKKTPSASSVGSKQRKNSGEGFHVRFTPEIRAKEPKEDKNNKKINKPENND